MICEICNDRRKRERDSQFDISQLQRTPSVLRSSFRKYRKYFSLLLNIKKKTDQVIGRKTLMVGILASYWSTLSIFERRTDKEKILGEYELFI